MAVSRGSAECGLSFSISLFFLLLCQSQDDTLFSEGNMSCLQFQAHIPPAICLMEMKAIFLPCAEIYLGWRKSQPPSPESAVFWKVSLQGWPLAGTLKLGFQEVPIISWLEWLTLSKLFMQTILFMLTTCLPPGSLVFQCVPSRGCWCDQPW